MKVMKNLIKKFIKKIKHWIEKKKDDIDGWWWGENP